MAAEALDARAVERALLAVNRRIAKAERALREMRPSVNVGADVFAFREMGSRGGERFDLLFPKGRDPADRTDDADREDEDEDAAFVRELAMTAPWTRTLVEPLLGSNDATPRAEARRGGAASPWCTRDRARRTRTGTATGGGGGRGARRFRRRRARAAVRDLRVLSAGGLERRRRFTQFWALSHRGAELIGFGGAAEVLRGTVDGIVQAGGAVAYDYRTHAPRDGQRLGGDDAAGVAVPVRRKQLPRDQELRRGESVRAAAAVRRPRAERRRVAASATPV